MRRRNIKNASERLKESKYYISNIDDYNKKIKTIFNNEKPLHVEIGMGKGQFILEMAKQNPNINFIGIEKYDSVLVAAATKAKNYELANLFFFTYDASSVLDLFNQNEIERIYLNFSDPWPKSGHQKRRLTHRLFLEKYEQLLTNDGQLWVKSDNRKFFEFSIMEIANYGFLIKNVSLDLHNSNFTENVLTEYEEKFSPNGPIYRLEAYKNETI